MKIKPVQSRIKVNFFLILINSICLFSISCHQDDYPSGKDPNAFILSILDSVKITEILSSLEHLTGERPYQVDGKWDSIKTRYSGSPQIQKSQNYIQNRLEGMGYKAELFPFEDTFTIGSDIGFAPGQTNVGWLIADSKIIGTVDGGKTWAAQYTSNNNILQSIYVLNDKCAWVAGDRGEIIKTVDGVSWYLQQSPATDNLYRVFFLNNQFGWICGEKGILLKTVNGGTNWYVKSTPTSEDLHDIHFVNENAGWAVGTNGVIIKTGDGGETWTAQNSGIEDGSCLNRLYFLDASHGFTIGLLGTILETVDGGTHWGKTNALVSNNYSVYKDIDFLDQNTGMIMDTWGDFLKTNDGGATWKFIDKGEQIPMRCFDMADTSTIWVLGSAIHSRTIEKSINSGITWITMTGLIPGNQLNNVYATITGQTFPDQYYIICAHYDSNSENKFQDAPGADDNASGTAGVLEAARVLSCYHFQYSIRFLFLSGEEQGLVGSRVYASDARAAGEQIRGVINLDMIGYNPNNDGSIWLDAREVDGSYQIGEVIMSNISEWGLPLIAQFQTEGVSSDNKSFWENGYPAISISDHNLSNYTPYLHSTDDRLSSLNPAFLLDNTRLAIGSIASLAE